MLNLWQQKQMGSRAYVVYRAELMLSAFLTVAAVVLAAVEFKVFEGESAEALDVWSAAVAILCSGVGPSLFVAALGLRSSRRRWWALQLLPLAVFWALYRALFR